jgi:hypothetical protein
VLLSSIPYGSLFGEPELKWTLHEYLAYSSAFSAKTMELSPSSYVATHVNSEIKADKSNPIALAKTFLEPLYLFGNNKQVRSFEWF